MEYITLSQLNNQVSEGIKVLFPDTYWVMGETSDVRINASNGHCYLELIEKNEFTGATVAKARAYIWNNTFRMIKPFFESSTGQAFVSGIKILVKVSIDFHPVYGYGLTVWDIEPSFTLGDIQRNRQQIIRQLEEEGILTLNKELVPDTVLQRIAIITSPTAAGYEDFLNHLLHHSSGFVFYTKLFPSVMQGEQTESSVIQALDQIYRFRDYFDGVVIIRGGGSTSDLTSFDSYPLAANCAQFPLPIITGIGHERDDTVLDRVAYRRAKTPTAVADFLIGQMTDAHQSLIDLQYTLIESTKEKLNNASAMLQQLIYYLPAHSLHRMEKEKNQLHAIFLKLQFATQSFINQRQMNCQEMEAFLRLSSPDYILSKGYTLTLKEGKVVKSSKLLAPGDTVNIRFPDGTVKGRIQGNE